MINPPQEHIQCSLPSCAGGKDNDEDDEDTEEQNICDSGQPRTFSSPCIIQED